MSVEVTVYQTPCASSRQVGMMDAGDGVGRVQVVLTHGGFIDGTGLSGGA